MLRPLPSASRPRRANLSGLRGPALGAIPEPRRKRILSFDIENRPLSYWYDGRCTAEVTAIAWGWTDAPRAVCVAALGESSAQHMLECFVEAYNRADIVTGHYIRKHDLPIINAALFENGMPLLRAKLTSDTRLDLAKWQDLPKSQEALGEFLELGAPKEHMSQAEWRRANRLTPDGVHETRRRVVGDVEQHVELRAALVERGLLGPPRWWSPGGARIAA